MPARTLVEILDLRNGLISRICDIFSFVYSYNLQAAVKTSLSLSIVAANFPKLLSEICPKWQK